MTSGHRREVVSIVNMKLPFRKIKDFWEKLTVGSAFVQVVATGAHVVDARGHAALGGGPALGHRVFGQRRINAGMHVRIDQPRKSQPVVAIKCLLGAVGRNRGRDFRELSAPDADIDVVHHGRIGPHHTDILDQQIEVFLGWLGLSHEIPLCLGWCRV